ncbi:MAG: ABC transporter permease [Polyangiaceae bacterium]|nr:ABC transporter permease [Polyangiaceae bacterium]
MLGGELAATLGRNKLRTLLTACGVFWGVYMLVVMVGIGKGLQRGTDRNLGGLSRRAIFVWSQRTSKPHRGLQPGRYVRFQNDDITVLERIPGVIHVAPRLRLGGWSDAQNVTAGARSGLFSVRGDTPALLQVEPVEVTRGRFVNPRDLTERRKVAVIGADVRAILFEDADPIGRCLRIRGVNFQVIGEVVSYRPGNEAEHVRASIFVPFSTFQAVFDAPNRVGWFALGLAPGVPAEPVEQKIRAALVARHRIHPEDKDAIGSFNVAERFDRVESLFRGLEVFLWFVGTLTLLAGVLGVSNILLITVKERTREFGIRKAVGATSANIVSMVVREALLLTTLSGYVGLVAGVGTLEVLSMVVSRRDEAPLAQPEVEFGVAVTAMLVLVATGVMAGIIPAWHAARIDPVEALRNE